MSFGIGDPAQRISQNELQRFADLRASGDPEAPSRFDAEAIVAIHNIQTDTEDTRVASVASATQLIYDKLSPLPDSAIPMAALLRAAFTVLAPGLSPSCSAAVAAAKIGATALLQQDIPLGPDDATADQFRDFIGLGAVHAVLNLASDSQSQLGAQQALNQYAEDAAQPGNAHGAAIHLVNFLSGQAERA